MIHIQVNHSSDFPPTLVEGADIAYYLEFKGITYISLVGLKMGFEWRLHDVFKNDLFIGNVEFMKIIFEGLGLPKEKWTCPRNNESPFEIKRLRDVINQKGIFIKPVEIKLFTGLVLDGCNYPHLNELPQDTEVYVYDAWDQTKIQSEWRGYIHNGKLDDIRNYSGNPLIFPKLDSIQKQIEKNKKDNFPKTYTIDVAIMEGEENPRIIEYNDMWAIGNYGVPMNFYIKYLESRYFEIVKG